jgi:hypothetical protein
VKARIVRLCWRLINFLRPKPDQTEVIRFLKAQLEEVRDVVSRAQNESMDRVAELYEARQMAGVGPWTVGPDALRKTDSILAGAHESLRAGVTLKESLDVRLSETMPVGAIGAVGDIELALQNVEWKRETNLSLLEFSRWGIQQIILISRLYYVKNPLIRRGCDVCAAYVFGRGVEVSSDNQAADDVLKAFFEDNKRTLGQIALAELEKRKWYDGNLFFVFFTDAQATGGVKVRTIDATEVMDIFCNPNDGDEPWFYRRQWAQKITDQVTGNVSMQTLNAWYPVIGWEDIEGFPAELVNGTSKIGAYDVKTTPVLHRKTGGVAKWHFGCPPIYPALDWAKTSRRLLEAAFTIWQSLAQISATLTTKGGQQALAGAKQTLATGVGPTSSLWDTNPTAVNASIFAAGPGTTLEAFKTTGAGLNPENVRRYIHWVAMVFGIPETFFADASVGSLATATSLDRPTELNFLERQEAWREDLTTISKFVLNASKKATGGALREALDKEGMKDVDIVECGRVQKANGAWVWEAASPNKGKIKIKVNFPAIREGDLPLLVHAWAEAMTLDNKGGQIVGIDEKEGVKGLFSVLGVENYQDIVDKMYPKAEYDEDRTTEIIAPPVPTAPPFNPGGAPQAAPNAPDKGAPKPASAAPAPAAGNKEAKRISRNQYGVKFQRLLEAVRKADFLRRKKENGSDNRQ